MIRAIHLSIITMFFLLFGLSGNAISGKKLYDDFSTGRLDGEKWYPRESVLEIVDEKLDLKLGNASGMSLEIQPGLFRKNIAMLNPETVHTVGSEIVIVEAIPDSVFGSRSFARIFGQFYNVNSTGGMAGDIVFEIMVGVRGNNGIEAFWEASEILTDDGSQWSEIANGTLIGPGILQPGIPYPVSLSYDGDRTITFSVAGVSGQFMGPERQRSAVKPIRSFAACVDALNGEDDGYVHATYDNVKINNNPGMYDDFSTSLIDLAKWDRAEWVRDSSSQYLRANVRAVDVYRRVSTLLEGHRDTPYMEAKVRIESCSWLSDGAVGTVRLGGYYFNDSRGPGSSQSYNGHEGDVFVNVRLRYRSDGNLEAQARVSRCNDSNQTDYTRIFWHRFLTPIQFDTDYVLSIEFNKRQLIFRCEDEQAVFNIETDVYAPYSSHRQLTTRLYADPGESGHMVTRHDDVYVGTSPLEDTITVLQILSGMPWSAEGIIPTDYDHDGKLSMADGLASLQVAAGIREIVEHSSMRYSVQHYYPNRYHLGVSNNEPFAITGITGPNVETFWKDSDDHWVVNFEDRPNLGDILNFEFSYSDGPSIQDTYIVTGINDNFSFITNPVDGSTINTATPTFTWTEATGIERYSIIIEKELSNLNSVFVWHADLSPGTTSAVYDFDATAEEPLLSGNEYTFFIQTFDSEGQEATTYNTFSVELP